MEKSIKSSKEEQTVATPVESVRAEPSPIIKEESAPMTMAHIKTVTKQLLSEQLRKFIEEETKMVKGRFRAIENPGDRARIQVKKYPGVPMFDKWMVDGEIYEIPLYAARHLNGVDVTAAALGGKIGTCSYPIHGFRMEGPNAELRPGGLGYGPEGQSGVPVPVLTEVKRKRRYAFESLEFNMG